MLYEMVKRNYIRMEEGEKTERPNEFRSCCLISIELP